MSRQASPRKHSPAEKLRILAAHPAGRTDWLQVAANNGISRSVAYRTVASGRTEDLPRGGARGSVVKVTPEVKAQLETYLNDNCTYTLATMRTMLALDMNVQLSTSTISRHLLGMHLALDREAICDRTSMVDADGVVLTIKKRTMRFLERAAHASMKYITSTVVTKMELHARDAVNAAEAMEDMIYGA